MLKGVGHDRVYPLGTIKPPGDWYQCAGTAGGEAGTNAPIETVTKLGMYNRLPTVLDLTINQSGEFNMPINKEQWLRTELAELQPPKTLTERNWVQIMLAERFQLVFKVDALTAIREIATTYGSTFPH